MNPTPTFPPAVQPVSWQDGGAPPAAEGCRPLGAAQPAWNQGRRVEPRPVKAPKPPDVPEHLRRPLGFNCPSCGVVLVIREPHVYDGKPAPCPHCAMTILPPRVVYQTVELHPLPGFAGRANLPGPRSPRAVHRPDRRGRIAPLGEAARPALPAQED